jgi:hypothetical protein
MTDRLFLLLERLQKLDATLRLAQVRRDADPFELARLRARKQSLKSRLARMMRPAPPAFG